MHLRSSIKPERAHTSERRTWKQRKNVPSVLITALHCPHIIHIFRFLFTADSSRATTHHYPQISTKLHFWPSGDSVERSSVARERCLFSRPHFLNGTKTKHWGRALGWRGCTVFSRTPQVKSGASQGWLRSVKRLETCSATCKRITFAKRWGAKVNKAF